MPLNFQYRINLAYLGCTVYPDIFGQVLTYQHCWYTNSDIKWHIDILVWHTWHDILTYNVLTYSKLENVSIDWQTDLMFWHIEILTYWNIDILTYWHVAEIKIYFLKRPWKSSMDLIIIFFSNNITFNFSGHWKSQLRSHIVSL